MSIKATTQISQAFLLVGSGGLTFTTDSSKRLCLAVTVLWFRFEGNSRNLWGLMADGLFLIWGLPTITTKDVHTPLKAFEKQS